MQDVTHCYANTFKSTPAVSAALQTLKGEAVVPDLLVTTRLMRLPAETLPAAEEHLGGRLCRCGRR